MGVSFDCFETLVSVDRPAPPATMVASALVARGITVPNDWETAYAEPSVTVPDGVELPLSDHVGRALSSRGVEWSEGAVREAVLAAFDPGGDTASVPTTVETRPGAREAVAAAREYGPVAICSNCSVPGLVEATLRRSALDFDAFDAIVTSVGCGWRKPAHEIFEETAAAIDVPIDALIHVGDDPTTDGGIESLGGTALLLDDVALSQVPERLEVIADG